MSSMFLAIAAAMLALALAFLLIPLLRHAGARSTAKHRALHKAHRAGVIDDAELQAKLSALAPEGGNPRRSRTLPAALALLLPLAAILLYRGYGEPRALDPLWQGAVAAAAGSQQGLAPGQAPDLDQAVAGLAERLRDEPDDIEGWMLLGRAYKSMERFEPAREALANALRLAPDNPDVLVEVAEAQVLASASRRFEGDARALLERALALQPDNQRGLWLLGIADYQDGRFAAAAATWDRLLAGLPADAEARDSLIERINDARQRAGLESGAQATTTATPGPAQLVDEDEPGSAASTAPQLVVNVDISPELRSRIGATDVLFVYARAAQGPRMPLAIQRLPASSLPVTVTLDDSTSMMPAMKLSTMPQVVVGARISRSGQASAQPGDLETLSDPVSNARREPMDLVIDRVVP